MDVSDLCPVLMYVYVWCQVVFLVYVPAFALVLLLCPLALLLCRNFVRVVVCVECPVCTHL